MLKKKKERILKLKLNPIKELLKFLAGNLIIVASGLLLIFIFSSLFYIAFIVIGLLIYTYAFLSRYDAIEDNNRKKLEVEFVEVFSYLRIYLTNKETVYTALRKVNEYTSKEMNAKINDFLIKIDEDKTILPFLEFGNYFKSKTIEEVMISLYQMVDGGYTENYLNQFILVFENLRKRSDDEQLQDRYKKMSNINLLTLIGSGYLMLVMLIVIVTIIGEMTNGF